MADFDWSSLIKPLVGVGLGAIGQTSTDDAQQQYLDYLKQRETDNYNTSVANINAYNTQGAADASSNAAADASARSAAVATAANRAAAAKKANTYLQNSYKKVLAMYAPYKKTADTLLPQMTQTYEGSLGLQNSLASLLQTPAQQARLQGSSTPAWQIQVPLPASVVGK